MHRVHSLRGRPSIDITLTRLFHNAMFHGPSNDSQMISKTYFLVFAQNKNCGYSLKPSQHYKFSAEIRKT